MGLCLGLRAEWYGYVSANTHANACVYEHRTRCTHCRAQTDCIAQHTATYTAMHTACTPPGTQGHARTAAFWKKGLCWHCARTQTTNIPKTLPPFVGWAISAPFVARRGPKGRMYSGVARMRGGVWRTMREPCTYSVSVVLVPRHTHTVQSAVHAVQDSKRFGHGMYCTVSPGASRKDSPMSA